MFKYTPEQQITVVEWKHGLQIAELLINEGYVVMLSQEEDYLVINYIWSERYADRNDVLFVSRDDYEMAVIENEITEVDDEEEVLQEDS
jgi:hypothetical protein